MNISNRLLINYIFNALYIGLMVFLLYAVWQKILPWPFLFAFMLLLLRLPAMLNSSKRLPEEPDTVRQELGVQPEVKGSVTPEAIIALLDDERVKEAIRADLGKTAQIGLYQQWRLGVIDPESTGNNLRLLRTAVLYSGDINKPDNLMISGGTMLPAGKKKWSFAVSTRIKRGEMVNLRDIQLEQEPRLDAHSHDLAGFLRQNGFPLKDYYEDGDPLSTDRTGTIVLDAAGDAVIIRPRYFTQRRLIDEQGSLVNLGADEDPARRSTFEVKIMPAVSMGLLDRVSQKKYKPLLRYRSVPYQAESLLPIMDTPMSKSGWADLFLDPQGKGRLYLANKNTREQWAEMMNRLSELYFEEVKLKDDRLVKFTQDSVLLRSYLHQKEKILADYYTIQDWNLD